MADGWLEAAAADSDLGRAVLAFDWGASPLGPARSWGQGLRSAVAICLSTRFPALVVWGPELIGVYNDGYRSILGRDKHPAALGAPAREVWPEVWDYVGPLFESVLRSGRPTWEVDQRLTLVRSGFREECFFTFSYSPLFDGDVVAAVLDLVFETTDQVVAKRRLECLSALNAALADNRQVTDVCVAATAAVTEHPADIRSADVFLRVGDAAVWIASNRRDLPVVGGLAVGGDWYDVIDLDDQRRALVVGDCVGHGLAAATVIAQLRSAARAMPFEGRSPAEVLSGLDAFAAHLDGAFCATVVCLMVDRATGEVTYCRAGHPPPLITGPAGHRWLDVRSGPPLAVASATPRVDITAAVEADDVIVLYSDGLVERRGESIDLGLSRLARAASKNHDKSAHTIADELIRELLPENTRNDVVLVVKPVTQRGSFEPTPVSS